MSNLCATAGSSVFIGQAKASQSVRSFFAADFDGFRAGRRFGWLENDRRSSVDESSEITFDAIAERRTKEAEGRAQTPAIWTW